MKFAFWSSLIFHGTTTASSYAHFPVFYFLFHNLNLSKHVFFIKKLYDLLLLVSCCCLHTQKYDERNFTAPRDTSHTTLNIYLSYYYIPVPKMQIKHFSRVGKSSQFIISWVKSTLSSLAKKLRESWARKLKMTNLSFFFSYSSSCVVGIQFSGSRVQAWIEFHSKYDAKRTCTTAKQRTTPIPGSGI